MRGLLLLSYGRKSFAASTAALDLQPVLDDPCVSVHGRVYELLNDLLEAGKVTTHSEHGVTLYQVA